MKWEIARIFVVGTGGSGFVGFISRLLEIRHGIKNPG